MIINAATVDSQDERDLHCIVQRLSETKHEGTDLAARTVESGDLERMVGDDATEARTT